MPSKQILTLISQSWFLPARPRGLVSGGRTSLDGQKNPSRSRGSLLIMRYTVRWVTGPMTESLISCLLAQQGQSVRGPNGLLRLGLRPRLCRSGSYVNQIIRFWLMLGIWAGMYPADRSVIVAGAARQVVFGAATVADLTGVDLAPLGWLVWRRDLLMGTLLNSSELLLSVSAGLVDSWIHF